MQVFLFFWMTQVFFQAFLYLVLKFLYAVGIPMHFPGLLCPRCIKVCYAAKIEATYTKEAIDPVIP